MKTWILVLIVIFSLALTAFGQTEIVDLGEITSDDYIYLDNNTTRRDFSHFLIELMPAGSSNVVSQVETNAMLTITNLVRVPSGRVIMNVRSVTKSGKPGRARTFTFDLWRAELPEPSATVGKFLRGAVPEPEVHSLTNRLRMFKQRQSANVAPPPPMPPMPGEAQAQPARLPQNMSFEERQAYYQRQAERGPIPPASEWPKEPEVMRAMQVQPLPGGRNETYAQHQDRMAEYYRKPGRRNE